MEGSEPSWLMLSKLIVKCGLVIWVRPTYGFLHVFGSIIDNGCSIVFVNCSNLGFDFPLDLVVVISK